MSLIVAGIIIGLLAGVSIIVVKIMLLTYDVVKNWFSEKLKARNKNTIPFSYVDDKVRNSINTAPKVTLGLFNTSTNKIEEAVTYDAEKVDKNILDNHNNNPLVSYT